METSEQPVIGPEESGIGPREGHGNGKALVALVLGFFAMANVTVFAVLLVLDVERLDDAGAWWMLLPFFALIAGLIATFLGSIGWIDVRRGITDRRLFEAQLGTVFGGIAAGLVVLAIIVLFVVFILMMLAFGAATGGVD